MGANSVKELLASAEKAVMSSRERADKLNMPVDMYTPHKNAQSFFDAFDTCNTILEHAASLARPGAFGTRLQVAGPYGNSLPANKHT